MKTLMLIVAALCLFMGFLIGTALVQMEDNTKPYHCNGYTVLDNEHIITCKGDTIKYQWQTTRTQ